MLWNQAAEFFTDDDDWFISSGGLWDIYVFDTRIEDWERFYRFVLATYRHGYFLDQQEAPAPSTAAESFAINEQVSLLLKIWLPGEIQINCFFLTPDEIELDALAADTRTEMGFCAVVEFMQAVGHHLQKPVALTVESWPESPVLLYSPEEDQVNYVWRGPPA